jgi:hypothetical protein
VPTPFARHCMPVIAPLAPPLVAILRKVVDFAPQSPAVNSGVSVHVYAWLAKAAKQVAAELHGLTSLKAPDRC